MEGTAVQWLAQGKASILNTGSVTLEVGSQIQMPARKRKRGSGLRVRQEGVLGSEPPRELCPA